MTFLILSDHTSQYKIMLTEIIQPIGIITNSSLNTTINNLSRKYQLCVCVCVGGGCVCFRTCYTHNIAGHIIYEFYR
jgi:hypothetical protein